MSRTTGLTRRVTRVTGVYQAAASRRYLTETAQELGVDPAELLAEYEHLTRRFQEVGAVTREAQIALCAEELGVSVEDLEAELATMEAGWR